MVEAVGGAVCAAAGVMAYAVRGKSSNLLAPSVHRGPKTKKRLALTFDDGPSESTPKLLQLLSEYRAPATFFQCGANVRRLPEITRQVRSEGHELGNHSDTHAPYYFRSAEFIYDELQRAQQSIGEIADETPRYHRVPYGVRWFGLRAAQQRLGLLAAMWTVIGLDWKMGADAIAGRIGRGACNGAILCLHDGRELQPAPDIRETVEAVRRILPALSARGFQFVTLSNLLCPTI
jgi:peptidoglycan-N-acetylglucosamine deacetylase